jgi:hypothetical protein
MIHMGTKTMGSNSVYKRIVESLSTTEWISFQEKVEICSWARAERKRPSESLLKLVCQIYVEDLIVLPPHN